MDQAVSAEKSTAEAEKKSRQLEARVDELREQIRKAPDVSMIHEIADLKAQLAVSERRIEAVKMEHNSTVAEKEQFRSNVHKLASAMCLSYHIIPSM